MKNILKIILTFLGMSIFIFAITGEIDGVGRFACVLFGVIFSLIGSAMNFKKK